MPRQAIGFFADRDETRDREVNDWLADVANNKGAVVDRNVTVRTRNDGTAVYDLFVVVEYPDNLSAS
jgi:hypothetical protein